MAELFRFRCFQCQKLMGAPPTKFGKTARCPRCGVELVVPTPDEDDRDDPGEEEDASAVSLEDLGVRLDPLTPGRSAGTSLRDPNFVEPQANPIAFLETAAAPPDPAPDADPEADPGGDTASTSDLLEAAVPINLGARVSPITGRRPIPATDDLSARRRDVVLPRTVALAWAMSALLGLGFAFAAGLLVGHYLWR